MPPIPGEPLIWNMNLGIQVNIGIVYTAPLPIDIEPQPRQFEPTQILCLSIPPITQQVIGIEPQPGI